MLRAIIVSIVLLTSSFFLSAGTVGFDNLVAAEEAIKADKLEEAKRLEYEKNQKEIADRARRNAIAAASKRKAQSEKLKADQLRTKLKLAETEAQIISDKKTMVAREEALAKEFVREKERLEERELEMMLKRAEVEAKVAAIKAKGSLATAHANADLDAKIKRSEAVTDTIRADNDAKRLLAEGSKKLLMLEGESRVISAGNPVKIEKLNVYSNEKD